MSSRSRLVSKTRKAQPKTSHKSFARNRFELKPVAGDETEIRILPPPNDEFYIWRHHWASKKPLTCTATIPAFGYETHKVDGELRVKSWGKCVCCEYRGAALKEVSSAKKKGAPPPVESVKIADNLRPRTYYLVEVIEFRMYHEVPGQKKDDAPEMTPCGNPGPKLDPRARNKCPHCASPNPDISKRHFGGRKVWEMRGKSHFEPLEGLANSIVMTCMHEHEDGLCLGEIYPQACVCPACEKEILQEREILSMEADEYLTALSTEGFCPHCEQEVYLQEVLVCERGQKEGDDHEPELSDITYCNLQAVFLGKKTEINNKEVKYAVAQFAIADSGFAPIEDVLEEWGVPEGEWDNILTPTDYAEKKRPMRLDVEEYDSERAYVAAVLEAQAKQLGRKNPYGSAGGGTEGEDDSSHKEGANNFLKRRSRR